MTAYLFWEQVLAIHEALVQRFGGLATLRDPGALQSAVARPAASFAGEDLYPDLPSKAAALFHSLVMNHPFGDGNKRVGVAAAELLIEANDHRLMADDGEFEGVTMATARGEMSAEALAIWFRQRTVRIQP